MNVAALRPLHCPSCGAPSDLLVWLDAVVHAWPGERRVSARCPRCEATAMLALHPGEAAIGRMADGPRPVFQQDERVAQPDLSAQASPDGLVIELLHRSFAWGPGPTGR